MSLPNWHRNPGSLGGECVAHQCFGYSSSSVEKVFFLETKQTS